MTIEALQCPHCKNNKLGFGTSWPWCYACNWGYTIEDWRLPHIRRDELFNDREGKYDDQTKLWNKLVSLYLLAKLPDRSVCECRVFITGCICDKFKKDMKAAGKTYNKVFRYWE